MWKAYLPVRSAVELAATGGGRKVRIVRRAAEQSAPNSDHANLRCCPGSQRNCTADDVEEEIGDMVIDAGGSSERTA